VEPVEGALDCGECSRGCSITLEVLRKREVKRIRPRPNLAVNEYWMCDHGRFSFPRFNAPGRLAGALARGADGLEPREPADALEEIADLVRVHGAPLVVASPWLTQEEGRRGEGARRRALLPVARASPLKDDFLPHRRPVPEPPRADGARLRAARPGRGRRAHARCGAGVPRGRGARRALRLEALSTLPASLRLVVFDTHPIPSPAACVELGVPDSCERTGTWLNVDGHAGMLAIARSAPPQVAPLVRTLEELARRTAQRREDKENGALAR